MRSQPGVKRGVLSLSLLVAGCTGGDSLPDDPRPPASAEAVVPPAAVSAVLSPVSPVATTTGTGLALPGVLPGAMPPVRDDPPVLSRPALPPEVVTRITRQHRGHLQACYLPPAGSAPPAPGVITIRYVIAPSGAVSSASTVSSTLPDAAMATCVVDVFRHLAFPSPTGPALVVTQTLYFAPPPP